MFSPSAGVIAFLEQQKRRVRKQLQRNAGSACLRQFLSGQAERRGLFVHGQRPRHGKDHLLRLNLYGLVYGRLEKRVV